MMKRNAHSPYVFIPLYHVRVAYRMIPGEFWSIFCVEIKKARSMDFPAVWLSSILETYFKTWHIVDLNINWQGTQQRLEIKERKTTDIVSELELSKEKKSTK